MKNFTQFREDLASGRPAKKPVSSNLLKQRAKDNENAMKSGFMKLSPAERAKESKRLGEDNLQELSPETLSSYKDKADKQMPGLHDKMFQPMGKNNANWKKNLGNLKKRRKGIETASKKLGEGKDMCSCNCDCGKAICESCGKPKMQKDITELSTKTLANYTRKAVSPLSKKSVGNLASKGAHKLAHSDPTDFDAGEKEDMKSVQRAKGVIRATKKIAKRAQANESALDEVSNELVKKVAHKRNQNVSMAGSKADYDRRDPNYQDAAKKQDRNQKLRFARGAKAIGKVRNESARDNYNPEISDKRTKEKLKKAGLPPESPKVMEAKKPIVHSTKPDSLKTIKIKYNKPIRTKVTDIGAGGKEYVRKDWSEETFKPHDMWSPKGEKKFAKTEKEHLALKDKGWGHNNPNKSEEKKKGLDGKECWDGYKQMGTKKKGGKTVDNCVKMKEEQIQLVTNLNQQEGVGAMVRRGLDKVRDSIKTAEVNTGLKVDASKNKIGQNPLKDSQKKR